VAISSRGVNPAAESRSISRLRALLKGRQIDVVLSYTPKGNLYSALACLSLKVPFVPNVSGLGTVFVRRSSVTWVAKALYRVTFRRAYRVFFQNLEDMQSFSRSGCIDPTRAERLPGSGVDLTRFRAAPLQTRSIDAPTFLLVARMLWEKGIGEYVTAARRVRSRFPGATFNLLGFVDSDNPASIPQAQLEDWVREGIVTYLGATDNVRTHIADADCAVLPSYYREGVPRVLLEAAAMARPVITTDAVGCRDTVLDGVTGFLCRPADAEDLAEKMLTFIDLSLDQRESMGALARRFIEDNFDERIVLERYLHVIADLATQMEGKSRAAGSVAFGRSGQVRRT
jgi:glycosyltransferase involved in cell wall biosynthesis